MKNVIKAISLTLSILIFLGTTGCSLLPNKKAEDIYINNNSALKNPPEESETYKNFFMDDRIANQWEDYGIGDPFIYRFDGIYYLVCSTKAGNYGVKGWKSTDLLNWEPALVEQTR